jgi:hypothetical protein
VKSRILVDLLFDVVVEHLAFLAARDPAFRRPGHTVIRVTVATGSGKRPTVRNHLRRDRKSFHFSNFDKFGLNLF